MARRGGAGLYDKSLLVRVCMRNESIDKFDHPPVRTITYDWHSADPLNHFRSDFDPSLLCHVPVLGHSNG